MTAIQNIRHTDLIFIPTTGLSIDDVVERNAPVVPWLKRWQKRGVAIASVCSGVGLVAATGMLDGKRATTHWALAERFREKYPKVKWIPELMVTEDGNFYCGGGVHAALDLSLYLVGEILWARGRDGERQGAAHRDAACLAGGVRRGPIEDRAQ